MKRAKPAAIIAAGLLLVLVLAWAAITTRYVYFERELSPYGPGSKLRHSSVELMKVDRWTGKTYVLQGNTWKLVAK